MRFYLDTSIWMDYFEDRKGKYIDYGNSAFKLLIKALRESIKIVVSDAILHELERFYAFEQIRQFVMPFQDVMVQSIATELQKKEAEIISAERKLPRDDALHAIIARDNNAVLVSRDRHFELLTDICKLKTPEDII